MSIFENNKVVAVIPFYNEEKTIASVIQQTFPFVDSIIAVNDGSTDNSLDNIKYFNNVIHCSLKKNTGKGAALREGFLKSIELESDITISLDADLQHPPEYIPDLLEKIKNYDIIIGSRKREIRNMPIQRIFSNYITSKMLSIKTGQNIVDSQSGFRAFKSNILIDILPTSNGFEAESEMLLLAARKKYRIGFTEIPTIYGNDNSKMKSFQAIKGFIKTLFS